MKFIDQEDFEKEIKNAIDSAVANLKVDNINVSDIEKKQLENKLINNSKIKVLLYKRNHGKEDNNE